MRKEESTPFGRPYNFMAPQDDQTPNKPMLPHWTTAMQAYYNPGSTPSPFYNHPLAAAPYLYHQYILQNQANNVLLQRDALHDPVRLSNKPHVVVEDAAKAFSEMVHRNFGQKNQDFNLFARNSQPVSLMTGESREFGNQSSAPKNDRDGTSMSAASGSKRSPDRDQDDSNKNSPLTKKHKSNMITADENSSGLAQNLGTVIKESDADIVNVDAQLKNMEGDDIRKERKRLSNRKSAKRSKIKKQQECEELYNKIDTLKDENSVLAQTLAKLSEECLELANENDSIEEELVKKYGPESIADLLLIKPA
ncbi:putative transcription factor bZIP family [Medicago truncatula]|uniref:BZIP transcription factor n=1 Tax=Medicago truncatula TaxID=3880 RepID=A0A072VRN1_MEDTR|nr:G-box-binding factor 1 [Medicago truncatula]KEH40780.1 bZIP transcription factor [Medicago truncatula]RHN78181.1 putative transcription factor bZIP family [Medicago truncatula]